MTINKEKVDYKQLLAEAKNLDNLKDLFEKYKNKHFLFQDSKEEISFLYNTGCRFSEYFTSKVTQNKIDYISYMFRNSNSYYYPIYCYLKGIQIFEENIEDLGHEDFFIDEVMKRCYVNIGNEMSSQYRTIDALFYYKKAILLDPNFNMAIGNRAFCLEKHSPFIDFNEQDKVFNYIYSEYLSIDLSDIEVEPVLFEQRMYHYYSKKQSYIKTIHNGNDANYDPYSIFNNIKRLDNSYENWCVSNVLYLNFLNDYWDFEEAKFDINIDKFCDENNVKGILKEMLNNMTKSFFKLREDLFNLDKDSDVDNYRLSFIFVNLFSFFDKVSFFIYKYFNLQTSNERNININKIWNLKSSDGHNLLDYKNQYLFNLFWMRKEYRDERDLDLRNMLLPDAQNLSDYRNYLEHKAYSFKKDSELYYINPELLHSKTIRLAQLVRNMLLSLIGMLKIETRLIDKKTGKRNIDLVTFNHQLF